MKLKVTRRRGDGETRRGRLFAHCNRGALLLILLLAFESGACTMKAGRRGIPPEVDSAIGTVTDDIAEGRYEKVYNEAADEWRHDATLEQSNTVFVTLKNKLGKVENRALHSASEEHNSGGRLPGHSFVIAYQTKFERGDGMETFTLVERNGHWLLARYFVNSTALN
jgi:Protein of unknown function (DUF4019)